MNAAPQTLHLAALSIGDSIPRAGFSAVVHSVFRSAVNLRHENSLLTLVAADEADLPQGIRVDTPVGFSFEHFKVGELVSCDGEFLRLASLTVDLHDAPRWKCDLPALGADLSKPAVLHAWRIVWQALNERQHIARTDILAQGLLHPSDDGQNTIRQRAGAALRELLVVAHKNTDSNLESPLRALIGLGTGLTPSGDDLLVGFLAGLWCAVDEALERRGFIDALSQEVSRLASRTNEVSRTYLLHAAGGQVSSRLAHLAEAICRAESSENLPSIFESAVQVGHSSGMDAVTGLLFGLAVDLYDEVDLYR